MAVKIKLKRLGKMRNPQYRIIVADARTKRDGRAIEEIGKYHPKEDPSLIVVDSERAQYWLSVGAQPTEPVAAILRVTGDWQKFRGEPGAEGTLRVAEPKASKKSLFEAAAKENFDDAAKGPATTQKKKAVKAEKPAEDPVIATVETVEVVETAEGDTVVVDEVVAVVETPEGEVVEAEVVEAEVVEAEVVEAASVEAASVEAASGENA
ncbi:MAG TPA: 30S ribosomal protein S16 [Candidatus Limnocylindria bacterium]|nr:30S ribosomal protein S16 [Candidatus Limnocylindria bacterium]